jgi:SPP1 gp7 family putative phage head morphogenesis protein
VAAGSGIQFKPLPPEEAIAYFKAKGYNLAPSWDWRDVWQREHATAFTVAKTAGYDVLKDIQAAVDDAISQGLTLKQFSERLAPILQAKGWWGKREMPDPVTGEVRTVQLGSPRRLKIIYDTNLRMSLAAGEWARIERTKTVAPYLRYTAILDGRTRPLHRAWDGTILPVDHPWWSTHFPPNGWRCRCSTIQLSAHDLDAMGWQVSPDPRDEQTVYANERTGEVTTVPVGIDPGFAYNPGQAALDGHAARALMGKLADASPNMAAAQAASARFVVPALKGEFGRWVDALAQDLAGGTAKAAGERFVAGALDQVVLDALASREIVPDSGAITISDRVVQHMLRDAKAASGRALAVADIRELPQILAEPEAILWDKSKKNLLYVFSPAGDGREGKVAVEVNQGAKLPRQPGKKAPAIVTNSVVTGGLVERAQLLDGNRYTVIASKPTWEK